ncbi:hypothetical protein RDI58_014520 [Solanum bulbocastanum]|uniref:Uncharacterized protein n=1 Tax=Solanum bulbocastanum TaxID=147425 RepID=A0AAN8YAM7_SOLBU
MRRISLRNGNGNSIPFVSFFADSAITVRTCSSCHYNNKSIPVKDKIGVNSSNLDDAVTLFHQMVTMKPLPSVVNFSKLFKNMISMKHYSAVLFLFREMQKLGIPIDGFILTSVINSYCLMHYSADCAFSVLPIYLKNGIPFNVVTFTTLLRGLFSENKVKDAVELFKKLVREDICEPNDFMDATVMNGLSKRGHTKKTLGLLRLMEQGNTQPDICIYNIVIDALYKDGNLDAAINILNEMKQKDIPPNIVTYNSIIDGLCKLGQWEKVKTLFLEMVNLNIYPDVHTFTILTDGLCKEGKVEDAEEVMKHMVRKGVEPDIITYNAIMDGYSLHGQVDRARRIFKIMIDKGIEPNNISYTILINGYCKKRNWMRPCSCFLKFVKRDQNLMSLPTILSCKVFLKLEE